MNDSDAIPPQAVPPQENPKQQVAAENASVERKSSPSEIRPDSNVAVPVYQVLLASKTHPSDIKADLSEDNKDENGG